MIDKMDDDEKEGSRRLCIYTKGVLRHQAIAEPNQTVLHHYIPPPLRTLSLNVLYYRRIVKRKYKSMSLKDRMKPLPPSKISIRYLLNKYTHQLYQLLALYPPALLVESINTPTSRTNRMCTTPTSRTSQKCNSAAFLQNYSTASFHYPQLRSNILVSSIQDSSK